MISDINEYYTGNMIERVMCNLPPIRPMCPMSVHPSTFWFPDCLFGKAESELNFNYPINCSVKSTIFRLISYSVYSPAMPEIRYLVIFIDPFVK